MPTSLYPNQELNEKNINGNQLLQVPELKFTAYGTYSLPLEAGANDFSGVYSGLTRFISHPLRTIKRKPMPMAGWIFERPGPTQGKTSSSPVRQQRLGRCRGTASAPSWGRRELPSNGGSHLTTFGRLGNHLLNGCVLSSAYPTLQGHLRVAFFCPFPFPASVACRFLCAEKDTTSWARLKHHCRYTF